MNALHYRLPADLVHLIEARLRSASPDNRPVITDAGPALSNTQIADLLTNLIRDDNNEDSAVESHPAALTAEEQAIKDHLLNEIRMRVPKRIVEHSPA